MTHSFPTRRSSDLARSVTSQPKPASPSPSSRAADALSSPFGDTIATRWPRASNSVANPRPSPLVLPVTTATLLIVPSSPKASSDIGPAAEPGPSAPRRQHPVQSRLIDQFGEHRLRLGHRRFLVDHTPPPASAQPAPPPHTPRH